MAIEVAEEKRDYEIYKEIKEIYKLEWERSDRLDDKAIGVVRSAGIIMALYMGLGTFTLEHISTASIYYSFLTMILMFGLTLFIAAILFGLSAFGIRSYKGADPRDFIEEYSERNWIELIHFYGGDVKNAILENRETNDKKARQIRKALLALSSGSATIILYALLILWAHALN